MSAKQHYFWFADGDIRHGQPTDKPAPQVGITRDIEVATRLVAKHAEDLANSLRKSVSWTLHDDDWNMGSVVGKGTAHPKKGELCPWKTPSARSAL